MASTTAQPGFGERSPIYKQSIGMVAVRNAQAGVLDTKLWTAISSELFHHLHHQSPRNISLVLNAFARIHLHDPALLDHIASSLTAPWLCNFNIQDLSLLCNAYARLEHKSAGFYQLCAQELLWKLPDASTHELVLIASAWAKLRAHDSTLFRHLVALSLRKLEAFSPRHLANMLSALVRLDALSGDAFMQMVTRLSRPDYAGELTAVAVSQLCGALAEVNSELGEEEREASRKLLALLSRRMLVLAEEGPALEARHLASMARACLQTGSLSRKLTLFLGEQLLQHASPRSADEIKSLSASDRAESIRGLVSLVDALASLRLIHERLSSSAADYGQLEEAICSSLTSLTWLLDGGSTISERDQQCLQSWDHSFTSWLQQMWTGGLRQRLLRMG